MKKKTSSKASAIKEESSPDIVEKSIDSFETVEMENDITQLGSASALKLCETTTDIDTIISLTRHARPEVRQRALKEMCPCRVKTDIDDFWVRVLQMINDPSNTVRYQVLHTLCDGSPTHMEQKVADALETFNHDPDARIRRQAHRALTSYRKTGKWNIL